MKNLYDKKRLNFLIKKLRGLKLSDLFALRSLIDTIINEKTEGFEDV